MIKRQLAKIENADLIERYIELSIKQEAAGQALDVAKANLLGEEITKISLELRHRPGDQRDALMPLLSYPSREVQFNASASLMSYNALEARRTMEALAKSGYDTIAARAGAYLSLLSTEY